MCKWPNLAIIGCGHWGKNLIRVFNELKALKVICDNFAPNLNLESAKYSNVLPVADSDEVFKDRNVDAVVIATPATSHYPLTKNALLCGKHVFVEKPLSLTIREGEELVSLAKERSMTLMVGHILHYHPAVIKLKELIECGALGKLQYIYSNRLNIGRLRKEENILWSFAPHDISVILMLTGEMPCEIKSRGGGYVQKGIYDTTITFLSFASAVKAHIFVSWLHPFKEHRLVVIGDKNMAVFDDLAEDKLLLYPHTIGWENGIPVACKANAEVVPVEDLEPLKVECRHFIDCVTSAARPKTDGEEGLRTLRVLSMAEESLLLNDGNIMPYAQEI